MPNKNQAHLLCLKAWCQNVWLDRVCSPCILSVVALANLGCSHSQLSEFCFTQVVYDIVFAQKRRKSVGHLNSLRDLWIGVRFPDHCHQRCCAG